MAKFQISRRKFLTSASLGLSGIALSGCDAFDSGLGVGSGLRSFLESANGLTYRAQRLLAGRDALAPEF
ncbi:MAG: molybdopterin oxidoreductase, partial [Mesorhizobium sp.]